MLMAILRLGQQECGDWCAIQQLNWDHFDNLIVWGHYFDLNVGFDHIFDSSECVGWWNVKLAETLGLGGKLTESCQNCSEHYYYT